jgi:hypothetical protein
MIPRAIGVAVLLLSGLASRCNHAGDGRNRPPAAADRRCGNERKSFYRGARLAGKVDELSLNQAFGSEARSVNLADLGVPRGLGDHTLKRGIDDGGWPAAVRYQQVSTQRDRMNWRLVIVPLRAQPFTASRNRRWFDKKRLSQLAGKLKVMTASRARGGTFSAVTGPCKACGLRQFVFIIIINNIAFILSESIC